jgi:glucose-1-phosphate adenylyltransferase
MKNTAAMIMAGGQGTRLGPLTCHRSKPAVPFGGRYRIIDFVLSNFVNSGYRRIFVLTQFMASSLIKHINRNWSLTSFDEFIEVVPAQMRRGAFWYRGTADAVYQNLNLIRDQGAEQVAVFGGDHIYQFDIGQMDRFHRDHRADLTVAAFPVPRSEAHQFGVIHVDAAGRIVGFVEKPADPPGIPGRPDWSLASMGNYFFRAPVLEDVLKRDTSEPTTRFDFGRNIIPRMLADGAEMYAYDFGENRLPGQVEGFTPYWRDVGTIDSYFLANMELRSRLPELDIYNRRWRIRSAQRDFPPARFVRASEGGASSVLEDSLVCEGSIVASALLSEVLLGYDCFVHEGSEVRESVILSGCDIGAKARLRRVILDKNCRIAPGTQIGHDPAKDRERFPFVTQSGIVVLPKATHVPAEGPIQFANDIVELMENSPALSEELKRYQGRFTVSGLDRHSHLSAGPRFLQYSRPSCPPDELAGRDQ